jgi:hypothetical protein
MGVNNGMTDTVLLWHEGKRVLHDQLEWESLGYYSMKNGKSYIYIKCPFCNTKTRAYVWSLAGSGKRCDGCDAQFASFGMAYRIHEEGT